MRMRVGAWVVLVAAVGCGGGKTEQVKQSAQVKGKVVVKNGNVNTLSGGKVYFQSVKDPNVGGMGIIEDEGVFEVGSTVNNKLAAGLPDGQYRARVESATRPDPDEKSKRASKGDLLPKYRDFQKSGLKYTINPGENTIQVEVEVVK